MSEKFSRRSFLKISGAVAVAAALAACSGDSGSGGGGGGGGGGDIDTNRYYNIDGLKMKHPNMFGVYGPYFYADLYFKNESSPSITLAPDLFEGCKFNGHDIKVFAFGDTRPSGNRVDIPYTDSSESIHVRVFFNTSIRDVSIKDIIDFNKKYPYTFTLVHGRRQAVCTGTYSYFGGSVAKVEIRSR